MKKKHARYIVVFILTILAKGILRKYKPKIVAVTGSVGKTGTKDAIFTIMNNFFYVRKSIKSYNSEFGVPLTIINRPTGWGNPVSWAKTFLEGIFLILLKNFYPKWLILEVGADRPGDIKKIVKWLTPNIVVFTQFQEIPVHVEFFESAHAMFLEKKNLLDALPENGVAILNNDDSHLNELKNLNDKVRLISFGFSSGSMIRATNYHLIYKRRGGVALPYGISFKVEYDGKSMPIKISGGLGKNIVYAVLAGLSSGLSQNLNMVDMIEALSSHENPRGRMRLLDGISGSIIIDDTYNSSPIAITSALETLSEIETKGRKIAVIGDMSELGKHTKDAHIEIGVLVAELCDELVTVGQRAQYIAEGAMKNNMKKKNIQAFSNSIEAGTYLSNVIGEGDIVLLKGSQSIRMEKAVVKILAEGSDPNELLVRQDKEWQDR